RRGMLGAIVLWTVVAALHAFAPGIAVLFALRLALGLAESPSYPAAVQTVQRALTPQDRARGMSTLFVGMSLGAMLVPPLAVWLQSRWGWRAAFGVTAGVGLLWIPLWLAVAWGDRARAALDAPALAATRVEWLTVLRDPSVLRALVAVAAVTPCSTFALSWEAKFYVRQFGLVQKDLGTLLIVSAFAYDCGALLFRDLAGRRARAGDAPPSLFGVATALAAAAMIALAFAPSVPVAVACMAVGGVGRGALVTLFNSEMAARAPRAAVSAAAGIIASAQAGV